jgi:ubiquinone/menaquinone biosynthesis C-methylase UbiE
MRPLLSAVPTATIVLTLALALHPAEAARPRLPQVPAGALEPENANEARLNRLQPPEKVMDAMSLRPGMTLAEIGAGEGRYVMQLAHRVGETGRVWAEDIDEAALSHLRQRCARWGIRHVTIVRGEVTDPKLPPGVPDRIFVISSYHHFADPVTLLRNARAALKPGGRLAIGEWIPSGDRAGAYQTPEQVAAQLREAGFTLERVDPVMAAGGMNLYIFRRTDDGTVGPGERAD